MAEKGPKRGADEAVFLRMELLQALWDSMALTKQQKTRIEKCLILKTMPEKVVSMLERILPETSTEEFFRELEFALVENHGAERYSNPAIRIQDLNKASINYRIYAAMDEIRVSCGYPDLRDRAMRLDDAARNAVQQ